MPTFQDFRKIVVTRNSDDDIRGKQFGKVFFKEISKVRNKHILPSLTDATTDATTQETVLLWKKEMERIGEITKPKRVRIRKKRGKKDTTNGD